MGKWGERLLLLLLAACNIGWTTNKPHLGRLSIPCPSVGDIELAQGIQYLNRERMPNSLALETR